MNKKLLLLALPTLLVLSSCGRVNNAQPQKQLNTLDGVVEDTLAHEEVFGEAVKTPSIRKMPIIGNQTDYKLGYQLHFDDKDNDDPSDDRISIRFVAALKQEYATMRWSRGISNYYGTEVKQLDDKWYDPIKAENIYLDSGEFFTTLTNGGADTMTAGEGAYSGFAGFIVYSIVNIPYEANKLSYLGVTLTLTPAEGDAVHTDFYAIKIETNNTHTESAYRFSFAGDKTGFFLSGSFGGGLDYANADASTRGSNAASFTLDLEEDDCFLVVQKEANLFKVWDGTCLSDEDTNVEKDSGLVKINTESKYVFYLNNSNNIYHTKYEEPTSFYVRGEAAQGWGDEDCVEAYQFVTDPDNKGVIYSVNLTVGDFKISDISWAHQWGYFQCKDGGDFWTPDSAPTIIIGGAAANFEAQEGKTSGDANIHCKVAGAYDIWLTNNWYVSIELSH